MMSKLHKHHAAAGPCLRNSPSLPVVRSGRSPRERVRGTLESLGGGAARGGRPRLSAQPYYISSDPSTGRLRSALQAGVPAKRIVVSGRKLSRPLLAGS